MMRLIVGIDDEWDIMMRQPGGATSSSMVGVERGASLADADTAADRRLMRTGVGGDQNSEIEACTQQ